MPTKRAAPARKAPATAPAKRAAAPAKAAARKAPPTVAPRPVPAAAPKPTKTKLVRDSFTIPKAEYAVIDALKQRAARQGRAAKKSELLRAGIKALAAMADADFAAAVNAVPAIKTGRPKQKKGGEPA